MSCNVFISKEEAITFVEKILNVFNLLEKLKANRLTLLNEIIKAYHLNIPFQNLLLLGSLEDIRRTGLPSLGEIRDDVYSKKGGLCYSLNVFLKYLLEAFGFEVGLAKSSVAERENHVVVLASNVLQIGDLFLVDGGTGFPTFEAVPLDFSDISPIYNQADLEYRFSRKSADTIVRWHRNGDTNRRILETTSDGWRRFYDFNLHTVPLSAFYDRMTEIYTIQDSSFILRTLIIISFTEDSKLWFKDGVISLVNPINETRISFASENDEIIANILESFSQFSKEEVIAGVEQWKIQEKKESS